MTPLLPSPNGDPVPVVVGAEVEEPSESESEPELELEPDLELEVEPEFELEFESSLEENLRSVESRVNVSYVLQQAVVLPQHQDPSPQLVSW